MQAKLRAKYPAIAGFLAANKRAYWPCNQKIHGKGVQVAVGYNGAARRSNAKGSANGKCTTYTSTALKAMLQALPNQPPTLIGKGSVSHSGSVPNSISIASCREHGKAVPGNSEPKISNGVYPTNINGETVWVHKGWHTAKLGKELLWCNACHNYVLAEGVRVWFPPPVTPKVGVKYYEGVNGINGNAVTGEKV